MNFSPIILIKGINNSNPEDLIKSIIGNDTCITCSNTDDRYKWKIDSKYYTADVQFHVLNNNETSSIENIIDNVEAIILYIDHSTDSISSELDECKNLVNNSDIDVKILISEHIMLQDEKKTADEWCCKNNYEFVDLEFDEKLDVDDSSYIGETYGIDRVVEALQNHQWSNLQLKSRIVPENSKSIDNSCSVLNKENSPMASVVKDKINLENSESSKNGDGHLDNMEELFDLIQNLKSMKGNISSLSGPEKLDQAEKVVKAFWNAIGGDMSEFSDSDNEKV